MQCRIFKIDNAESVTLIILEVNWLEFMNKYKTKYEERFKRVVRDLNKVDIKSNL